MHNFEFPVTGFRCFGHLHQADGTTGHDNLRQKINGTVQKLTFLHSPIFIENQVMKISSPKN